MKIRDRIKELRRVPANRLVPNPKNWRKHPTRQKDVLQGVLAEIGYADALLVRELADGRLQLIDGHLRAKTTPHQDVPVLILDLDEEEANKLLTVFDPIAGLAEKDQDLLEELVRSVETSDAAIRTFLGELIASDETETGEANGSNREVLVPELYQVLVECENEEQQRELYEELVERRFNARLQCM